MVCHILTLITAVLPKASKYTSEFVENLLCGLGNSFIAAIIMIISSGYWTAFYKNFMELKVFYAATVVKMLHIPGVR